ncbi:hypothetical protein F6W96_33020 [Nocardia terpenica]|uniref:FAD-binding domain-containing protein n=1 Tax=Nocardia terpenica TaxID=455432 RepID=A0A6G9ZBR4_9NOCA|nr:hypothetical protein F6W96_33020 [Nocardia terpenica]
MLVAADGVGSAIRARRLPHARVVDSGIRLIYGRVPLTSELRGALPEVMFSVFNSIVGPGHRLVGIAPVQYREPPHIAASRLAPEVALEPAEDGLAATLAAAMTDAADGRPLPDALGAYEQSMIEEGFRMVRLSAANGTRTLAAEPLPE